MAKLPINAAVNFGWQTTLKNKRFLIGVTILSFVVQTIFNVATDNLANAFTATSTYLSSVFTLLSYVVGAIFTLGLVKISLEFVDHGSAKLNDLWWVLGNPGKLLSYFGAFIVYGLVVGIWALPVVGLSITATVGAVGAAGGWPTPPWILLALLFLIPLVYFAVRYSLFDYGIVDHHDSALASLGRSSQITKGVKIQLILFGLTIAGINLLGALALAVGLLLTIPTTMLAAAYIYRHLSPK